MPKPTSYTTRPVRGVEELCGTMVKLLTAVLDFLILAGEVNWTKIIGERVICCTGNLSRSDRMTGWARINFLPSADSA